MIAFVKSVKLRPGSRLWWGVNQNGLMAQTFTTFLANISATEKSTAGDSEEQKMAIVRFVGVLLGLGTFCFH